MPNIAIINYCNLQCPYCFAEDMKHNMPHNLSIEEYQHILDFVARAPERVGIIGGEPTLHPDFSKILDLTYKHCVRYNSQGILFTNGINLAPFINQIAAMSNEYIQVLINCNKSSIYSNNNWQKFNTVLDIVFNDRKLIDYFRLGCNIFLGENEYTDFWSLVTKYHVSDIRASVASPGGIFYNKRNNKQLYYAQLKEIFIKFVKKAKELNVNINLDCNQIPVCFFNEKEQELINSTCNNFQNSIYHCSIPIDIISTEEAVPCFGNYQPVNYHQFKTIHELRTFFIYNNNYQAMMKNYSGPCGTCKRQELSLCQGGCLAFSEINRTSS